MDFTSLPEIPGLILSALLVDRFGRKATMWCLLFACCAFLGPLVLHQNELLTTSLLFGARACGTGSTTVLCLYAPEVRINFLMASINLLLRFFHKCFIDLLQIPYMWHWINLILHSPGQCIQPVVLNIHHWRFPCTSHYIASRCS